MKEEKFTLYECILLFLYCLPALILLISELI